MSNSTAQAVTEIIRIGHNSAYQIICRTLKNGARRYSFKHGLFWINPNGNIPTILHACDLGNYDEQTKTRLAAKKHLEAIIVQHTPNQTPVRVQVVHRSTTFQSSLPKQQYQIPQQSTSSEQTQRQQSSPQPPQGTQPPKPWLDGDY